MGGSIDRREFLAGALGLAGLVALNACGGDDSDAEGDSGSATTAAAGAATTAGTGAATTAGSAGGDLTTVKLGLLPITDVAPLFLAQTQGVFAEHGLSIEPTFAAGGAAILPSVESGEFDIGYSNIVSLLLLQSRGGSFKILAGGGLTATGSAPDYSQMLVKPDSPLQGMADLAGKKVAINTLKNALEIVTRASVEKAGADQESVQFVEIPFPDMGAALEAGQVDAILCNEPFQTILQQAGSVRVIGKPFVDAAPGEVLAFYFVKSDKAGDALATGFSEAMAVANANAAADEAAARTTITEYTEVAPDVANELVLPTWVEDSVRESSLQVYAELMAKYGLVDEVPDYQALLP